MKKANKLKSFRLTRKSYAFKIRQNLIAFAFNKPVRQLTYKAMQQVGTRLDGRDQYIFCNVRHQQQNKETTH